MMRITPRTCLWPLTGCLIFAFALSLGLTFISDHHCYAGTCGEWLFPFQARLHVVVWYAWLSLSVTMLALRSFRPRIQSILRCQLGFSVPLLRKQMRLSGLLMIFWILALYGILIGIWWIELRDYFQRRGGDLPGNNALAAVALTGHLADVTMGMVLLPVSRNSALASFFKLSPSTTFTFHIVQAHVLFGLVVIHGALYADWVSLFNRAPDLFRAIFPVLNPTYLFHEVWPGDESSLGIWRASLIFTGAVASLIMMLIFLTSFPVIRRKHFNLFYFTHLLGIVAVIVICLHASTMLYCTLPGLSMWLLDWGMRIYELSGKLDSRLEHLGRGWYCLSLPLPRKRLSGCACHSPLAHFYIHHTESSIREIHPFTTITHLATKKLLVKAGEPSIRIEFLFRKSISAPLEVLAPGAPRRQSNTQWTSKLASLVDAEAAIQDPVSPTEPDSRTVSNDRPHSSSLADTTLRLEGPYFTLASPGNYTNVLCLVAGTGLSGALAIGAAFTFQQTGEQHSGCAPNSTLPMSEGEVASGQACTVNSSSRWKTCTLIWSVRETDYVDMPFFAPLRQQKNLSFHVHKTGSGRARLDMARALRDACAGRTNQQNTKQMEEVENVSGHGTWVYISGPSKFIEAAETECRKLEGLEWFAARWD